MVIEHTVEGYDNFCKFFESSDRGKGELVHILFSGAKGENGQSWCSDCVEAEPAIQGALNVAPRESHFVTVEVGDRPFWKDLNCPFRKDRRLRLLQLPTLMRWGDVQRLDGDQCKKQELVEMLFLDEDER